MKHVDLVYFNAGGGHRAAALALQAVCEQQQRPWKVRLVNLVDVVDPQALFQRYTGMAPEDLYNKRLARGWTLGLAQELKLLQGLGFVEGVKAGRTMRWSLTEEGTALLGLPAVDDDEE